jgi:hypothetical protein
LIAYIIVEDYEPEHIEETLTRPLPYWYPTEDEALSALHDIARDLMVDMPYGERKFLAPPESGIFRDTYYIMELNRG